jgi:alanine racemase
MPYCLGDIAAILQQNISANADMQVEYLVTDSRNIIDPVKSIFFAIKGPRRSGISFVNEVYQQGVRIFIVEEPIDTAVYAEATFIQVSNVIAALQQIAAYHRKQFSIPVIGITGSNGKTIVKEWLYQLLQSDYHIVRSPRSYNSKIGVPLSVWQMNAQHTLAIFEVGISAKGEMQALANIVQPTIGVFTNLGEAHNQGFDHPTQKLEEKSKLFQHTPLIVTAADYMPASFLQNEKVVSWGSKPQKIGGGSVPQLLVVKQEKRQAETAVELRFSHSNPDTKAFSQSASSAEQFELVLPFADEVSVQNALTCVLVLLQLGYAFPVIQQRVKQLQPVEMRMQLKRAINQSYVLNDSYSNDKVSLSLALQFLKEQAGNQPIVAILSDIVESGESQEQLYGHVVQQLSNAGVKELYAVGPQLCSYFQRAKFSVPSAQQTEPNNAISIEHIFPFNVHCFEQTSNLLEALNESHFQQQYILLKGARKFAFEQVAHWLEQQVHQTIMEINLTAMVHNLKEYQSLLQPQTKMMAMVKAFGYGSGAGEVARRLQQQQVDYLSVAYADEGVTLRKAGIHLPIMVMSADEYSFDAMVNHSLEPELFSFPILEAFHDYIAQQGLPQYPIHLKLNTGMNRLGFDTAEIDQLCNWLQQQKLLRVKSVLSHLAASEDKKEDAFTQHQVDLFTEASNKIEKVLGYSVVKHIANTAAIRRNPNWQFNMVRLGIGLYGADNVQDKALSLQTVATLKTTVAQVRHLKAGETVSYNRSGVLTRDSIIATVRIGYADGYSRRMGNGNGKMYVRGCIAPTVGKICMDMCMIDVTDIPGVKAGDPVEIFGKHISIQEVAKAADTIAYEIMTGISLRVKRVYIEE